MQTLQNSTNECSRPDDHPPASNPYPKRDSTLSTLAEEEKVLLIRWHESKENPVQTALWLHGVQGFLDFHGAIPSFLGSALRKLLKKPISFHETTNIGEAVSSLLYALSVKNLCKPVIDAKMAKTCFDLGMNILFVQEEQRYRYAALKALCNVLQFIPGLINVGAVPAGDKIVKALTAQMACGYLRKSADVVLVRLFVAYMFHDKNSEFLESAFIGLIRRADTRDGISSMLQHATSGKMSNEEKIWSYST
jgi:hypothetical protein